MYLTVAVSFSFIYFLYCYCTVLYIVCISVVYVFLWTVLSKYSSMNFHSKFIRTFFVSSL